MAATGPLELDVVIFGGGGAGLWLLDELVRHGFDTILLEAAQLGRGQTIASQGIIHGGLKYSISGLLTPSAQAVRDMPARWRQSLTGQKPPQLTRTLLRGEHCHLWQTAGLKSKLAMFGARAGLRVTPAKLSREDRPPALGDCPGVVARLDEQVIEPASFLADLAAQHLPHLLRIDAQGGLRFELRDAGQVEAIDLIDPDSSDSLILQPRHIVFTAGAGNVQLRRAVGLSQRAMQRRPLHMVMLRGELPTLNGHCVDGATTQVTITSAQDSSGATVWQVGGRVSEIGVAMSPQKLVSHTRGELEAVLPGVDLGGVQWATYRIDRAEGDASGRRPDDVSIIEHGNVITAWPTKLALVPRLAQRIVSVLGRPASRRPIDLSATETWPRPVVAQPPWEMQQQWFTDV